MTVKQGIYKLYLSNNPINKFIGNFPKLPPIGCNPELIKKFSLNGDLNDSGLKLSKSYYDLIHQVGNDKYKKYIMKENNSTINILKESFILQPKIKHRNVNYYIVSVCMSVRKAFRYLK